MLRLESIWQDKNRTPLLLFSGAIALAIALVDWLTLPYISLGILYLFPILLAAGFLPRWGIVIAGIVGAVLSELLSNLDTKDAPFRIAFETLALTCTGLFASELVRNRRMSLESEERLRILVETSPAAIVTVSERGIVEKHNRAASALLAPLGGNLLGLPIATFLPELQRALRPEEGPQFRASMQCRGRRDNGEAFLADVWFSTYREGVNPKLAAIIADVSEDDVSSEAPSSALLAVEGRSALSNREIETLRLVFEGLTNKEVAARLQVTESTVKNILQQLFVKTRVRTRAQLVRVALERYRDLL